MKNRGAVSQPCGLLHMSDGEWEQEANIWLNIHVSVYGIMLLMRLHGTTGSLILSYRTHDYVTPTFFFSLC